MPLKKKSSNKAYHIKESAKDIGNFLGRELKANEWSIIGKLINEYGFINVCKATVILQKSNLNDKDKAWIPYIYTVLNNLQNNTLDDLMKSKEI